MFCGPDGGVLPATSSRCSGFSGKGVPVGWPVAGSSSDTSTTPFNSVMREFTLDPAPDTSVTTTVPRTAVTAFGVFNRICSPGFIRSRATLSATFPVAMSMIAVSGVSVMVKSERSRTVTTALPPSSMRARDWSPVVMRSRW